MSGDQGAKDGRHPSPTSKPGREESGIPADDPIDTANGVGQGALGTDGIRDAPIYTHRDGLDVEFDSEPKSDARPKKT